jgi:hypothetical protein
MKPAKGPPKKKKGGDSLATLQSRSDLLSFGRQQTFIKGFTFCKGFGAFKVFLACTELPFTGTFAISSPAPFL